MSMEALEDVIATSPKPETTRRFLVEAGPDQPELIGPDGPMPKISVKFPETLPAGKRVNLTVRVSHVREREGLGRVEIVHFNDAYSKKVLSQQSAEIDLRFNKDNIEFKDLAGAQYLPVKLTILATADCATHRKYARKAALTLCEVTEPRKTIDGLHAMTQKLQWELDFDAKAEESKGTERSSELGTEQ